jgi:hypothetical protein
MVVLGWKTIYKCTARVPEIEWMLQRRKDGRLKKSNNERVLIEGCS